MLDNIDPSTIAPLLDRLDLSRTLFDVVSKSGTTAETMAQFLIIRDRLLRTLGEDGWRRQVVFTTDPDHGVLRRIATSEGITAFPIPPNVGGRFSVLSAVGLLPAALVGIDVDSLLEGARAMEQRCATDELTDNPAGLFAALQYLADTEAGAPIHVMMAYSDRLYAVADWFRQLWAESLGKRHDRSGAEVFRAHAGQGPGATDQHSQVQLYGGTVRQDDHIPRRRALRRGPADPRRVSDIEARLPGGHTGEPRRRAHRHAQALASAGRMNMTLLLPAIDAHAIGQLFMLFQIATIYAGAFYDIDPLDQPGVELGKRLTYARMGRPGFESPAAPGVEERWVVA